MQTDIRVLRESMGLSPEQLSRVIGVSHTSVYNWEKGTHTPSPLAQEKIEKLARRRYLK